jgi:hypothetical protein
MSMSKDGMDREYDKFIDIGGMTYIRTYGSSSELLTEVFDNSGPNNQVVYHGWANPGTAKSATGWRICKYVYDGNGMISDILWPDSSVAFNKVWNDRATGGYVYA